MVKVDRQLDFSEVQTALADIESVSGELKPYGGLLQELFFQICPLIKSQRLQRGVLTSKQKPLPLAWMRVVWG
ncbi:hypothetical protein NON20_17740 [Synechocystis sp. B12]|nr:hypothetical protein NON20_17740 [Synechocystis sp. B12]